MTNVLPVARTMKARSPLSICLFAPTRWVPALQANCVLAPSGLIGCWLTETKGDDSIDTNYPFTNAEQGGPRFHRLINLEPKRRRSLQ